MKKIFDFLDKYKGVIGAITIVAAFLVVILAFYKKDVNGDETTLLKSNTIGGISAIDDEVVVKQGQTMVQKYSCSDTDYTQIGFVAHPTTEKAVLEVTFSNGTSSQTVNLQKEEFQQGYTYIDLKEQLRGKNEVELIATFKAKEGSFLFSANKTIEVENSICTIDGVETEQKTNVLIDMRTLKGSNGDVKYFIVSAIIVAFLVLLIFAIKLKWFSVAGLTALSMAAICIICFIIFPPFTVPDEQAHYKSVYHISNMIMSDFSDEQGALRMRQCDYDYFMSLNPSVYSQQYISEKGFDTLKPENTDVITTHLGYMENKLVPHFAAGLGLTIARIFGLGAFWGFTVARIFNAAMGILLVYFAIKIIPFGKAALAVISLIPINVHIIASCSYDAYTFGGIILLFAYIMRLMYREEKIDWKELIVLALLIALIVPQKVVYIGVAALVLIIPKKQFVKEKWHFAFKCALGIFAIAAILILQSSHSSKLVSDTVTNTATAGYSIGFILKNPFAIAKMLFNTIFVQSDFYIKSFVSYFAWFELDTPWGFTIPYLILIFFAFLRRKDEPQALDAAPRIYSLMLFAVVFIMVELLLLLDHTPMGNAIILGVQGRYFIPALPLLFIFFRNKAIEIKENIDGKLIFLSSVINCAMFIFWCSKIV